MDRGPWTKDRFPLAVGLLAALSFVRYVPDLLSFTTVAFGDAGWPLAVDALLDDGLTPTRDFGYFYGLLALAVDRVWFALVGRTPGAVAALIGVGCLFVAVGLVRFARAARLGWWARLLLACAVPTAVIPLPYPTPVHAIELALLVNALADQARGRYATALVLVTLAVFVKPGLGLVHGLVLVLLVLGGYGAAAGWRGRARALLPAVAVGLAVAAGLAGWFGTGPLGDTLLPFRAARNYDDEKFGFFSGDGRQFWLPDRVHPFHYLLTPAGFWIAATLWLTAGAVWRVRQLRDPVSAVVVTSAVLHAVFVLFLFGNQWSWLYYSAILVCGLCAVIPEPAPGGAEAGRGGRVLPGVLAGLAVLGQFGPVGFALGHWREWRPSEPTAGLYALPADAAAWDEVRAIGRRERVMAFANTGGVFVVFPEVDGPRVWFLLRSTATPAEIDRVRGQLRAADWLVLPHADRPLYPTWPEFTADLEAFHETGRAPSFRLYRRAARPSTGPGVGRPGGGE